MAVVHPLAFSTCGTFLAYSSPDGVLKLWDTTTGDLKQEYTPSAHLSATCSCLSWWPTQRRDASMSRPKKKRKKRKSNEFENPGSDADLLAMGTTTGSIFLYSVTKADVHSHLDGGHCDVVNCIAWHTAGNKLYSCSNDTHVVQWDLNTGSVRSKWKVDRGAVYSIAVAPDGRTLLSASQTIKWWDVNTQHLLKRFTGHGSEVHRLQFVTFPDWPVEDSYFVSAAVEDRLLCAWHLKSPDNVAVASFSLSSGVTNFDIALPSDRDQSILLSAVSQSGILQVFEHQLNGKCKKPIAPKMTLQVATEGSGNREPPRPIPVLGSCMCCDDDQNILIVHGNFMKMVFEKLSFRLCQPEMCLIRQDPMCFQVVQKVNPSKIKEPDRPEKITVLTPGHMVPSMCVNSSKSSKQRKSRELKTEIPMEARLQALSLKASYGVPRADNVGSLLMQGLQSNDNTILDRVLTFSKLDVLERTMERVPVQSVIPLLKILESRLQQAPNILSILSWVRAVLTVHASYLMSQPNLSDVLSSLYQLLEGRSTLYTKIANLRGRTDILLAQLMQQASEPLVFHTAKGTPIIHEDDSSDETIEEFDFGHDDSDNGDMSSNEEEGANGDQDDFGSGD